MSACKKHHRRNCLDRACRAEARRAETTTDSLTDPTSPLHQATYGGVYYGSDSGSSSDCGSSSSSSSYDSGSSSCDSGGGY